MGERLATLLNSLIDGKSDDDTPRAQVISAMADAAGIDAGTVNQILDTSIDCPPLERLEGFARALDTGLDAIRSAAEEDGCSYRATEANAATAIAQAMPVPDTHLPAWLHILPAGTIETVDSRGPFKVTDLDALAARSIAAAGGRLAVDENHSIDLAAPKGGPSPARGWITQLETREDGIWGLVEWTQSGRTLMADKGYRFLSPVFEHLKDGTIITLLRVALTNNPNLRQLTALNSEDKMDLLKQLCAALGLAEGTDAAGVIAAIKDLKGSNASVALQAAEALKPIALAAGLAEDADAETVLNAVKEALDPARMVPASQVAALQAQLSELTNSVARDKAEAAIDGAIAAGKVGIKPLRDHYISRHMKDPEAVQKELDNMISLTGTNPTRPTPPDKDGKVALNEAQSEAAKMLGLSPDAYQATLAAEAAEHEGAY